MIKEDEIDKMKMKAGKIIIKIRILEKIDVKFFIFRAYGSASKRNLTFNLLDPDQIRLTLCYTDYFALKYLVFCRK